MYVVFQQLKIDGTETLGPNPSTMPQANTAAECPQKYSCYCQMPPILDILGVSKNPICEVKAKQGAIIKEDIQEIGPQARVNWAVVLSRMKLEMK